jgi:pyridoxamine 5'-phosphate oxidase
MPRDPLDQFRAWMRDAESSGVQHPNAMVLATATRQGEPSARVVLLKEIDERGFVFYTNYESRKGDELAENPQASLLFHWEGSGRQVRVEGMVERTSRTESEEYFATRPRDSQIGAWASHQSSTVAGRRELERCFDEVRMRFENRRVPLPPDWGGYRLLPRAIEFWQEREHRLHDRLCYRRLETGWEITRLNP